jgi:methylmalonyl-CoA mutase N-terminal domain/subunit
MAKNPPYFPQYLEEIGFPGEFPFVRGIHPTMYRGRPWTMRQYAGFGTASEANTRFHYLLKQGQPGLSVAFDLPTQLGIDSDETMARGEVGRVGVAVTSVADMETLYDEIPLQKVSSSMTINATASTLLCFYAALAKQRGIDWSLLRGTVQNDILKEFIARGNYIYPPAASLRLVTDLIAYCHKLLPNWYPISISGYHIREAGATAVQELAFTFANALEYVRASQRAKLPLHDILKRLTFFFSVDNLFLEEIAKFRAARRLWSALLMQHFGLNKNDTASMTLRFHAQTGGSTLTAQQPKNNIIRVTMQALAAVLGGTQSLHTNSWDEALALPSELSAQLALRTQQIIAEESEVIATVDPLGGAWDIEERTNDLFEEAMLLIAKIDALGGAVEAVEQQFFQRAIAESAYQQQVAIEKNEKVVVGVNRFATSEDRSKISLMGLDPQMESRQIDQLKKFRAQRASAPFQRSITALAKAAENSHENLLPYIFEAVTGYTE